MDLDSYFNSLGFDSLEVETQDAELDKAEFLKEMGETFHLPEVCPTPVTCLRRSPTQPLDGAALEQATHELRLLGRQLDQPLLLPIDVPAQDGMPSKRQRSRRLSPPVIGAIAALLLPGLGGLLLAYQRHCPDGASCSVTRPSRSEEERAIAQDTLQRATPATPATPAQDAFRVAVNEAMRAAELTQTAKTAQEWNTVAHKWLRAIELMRSIPPSSARYPVAVQKAGEYARNLTYAQRQVEQASAQELMQESW